MTEIFESDRLPTLADFLGELAAAVSVEPETGNPDEAQRDPGFVLAVSEIKADLPFELDLLQEHGVWQLDAAPPTQKIETSVMPVFHRLRIRVTLDDGERSHDTVES